MYIDCQTVECSEFENSKLESIRATLQDVFQKAVWQAPAVVILEDLDKITPAEGEVAYTPNLLIINSILS
jgi:SpoVK/Ycf46/Vps4 family AAA+-type ATPase